MRRRSVLKAAGGGFVAASPFIVRRAVGGVTDTEIRIAGTAAYTGPASAYGAGFGAVMTMIPVLKQCGNNFSPENLMKQATNLSNVEVPSLLPGIRVNTSPTNYHTISQIQMMRWNSKSWDLFGEVLSGGGSMRDQAFQQLAEPAGNPPCTPKQT